jgi:hypothetical protein
MDTNTLFASYVFSCYVLRFITVKKTNTCELEDGSLTVRLGVATESDYNATIIPSAQFDVIGSAHSIASPNISAETSTFVYGLGWFLRRP